MIKIGESILRVTFPYHRGCDICHKTFKSLYRIELDGVPVFVCTGAEANLAKQRWEEKKKLNMNPYQKTSLKEEPMMEAENIPGGEEE